MGGQHVEGGALDEYDQMIFNQFMDEDEGEMMARKMQQEMNQGFLSEGSHHQILDPASVRKADSEEYAQLIGGDEGHMSRGLFRQPGVRHDYGQPPMYGMGPQLHEEHDHSLEIDDHDMDYGIPNPI